ncbi:MAG: hypothetical protein US65_C0037G0009 [Candidatus Yanofskybacteria bacterium GW2011_GWC2_37_9]|uniref:DUF916 domain-containing protein n=1 Tax=Candidatus Yanofskybacteria bacterium GW2011_GWC2_37_9 TaxID=1619028 RepID=A0A0G0HW38_9BACT|nr:MAG: hypothetical protein US65_C0037G0009 [Candidatus Yanofskybacteria bacterium GW2011_GWC2_37_9]
MRKILKTTICVFVLIVIFFFTKEASALTLSPIRFEISGNPGDTLQQEITLINETNRAETYSVSYSNFEAQGESGDPAFVAPKDGLGTWIRIESNSIAIPARQQKIIPFTINIPKDADPGGHFAVIFWGTSGGDTSSGVSIGAKTGVLVLLSVNGDVKENAGLLSFNTVGKQFWYSTLPVSFEYRFKNDGGDRIKPQGKIIIHNTVFFPTEYLNANRVEGNILPASTRKFKVDWINYERSKEYVAPTGFFAKFWSDVSYQWKNFAVGFYTARLNVAYGASGEHAKGTAFLFVFPWQLVLVMLVVFIVVFWGGKKVIKRYNKFIIDKNRLNGN